MPPSKKVPRKKIKATKTSQTVAKGKRSNSDEDEVVVVGVKKNTIKKPSGDKAIKPKNFCRPQNKQPPQKPAYDKRPKNDAERARARQQGLLWGYCSKRPGRPKKDESVEIEEDAEDAPPQLVTRANTAPEASRRVASTTTAPRGKYKKYEGREGEAMNAAVDAYIAAGNNKPYEAAKRAAADICSTFVPNRTTLVTRVNKEKERRQKAVSNDDHYFDRNSESQKHGLTSKEDRELLQDIAVARDNQNNGMGRKEMIHTVAAIKGVSIGKATNHYKYLVRAGHLKKLKRGGRVVRAQETTTNRTAITTEKLLRTYLSQEEGKCFVCFNLLLFYMSYLILHAFSDYEAMEEQARLNGPNFIGDIRDHFTGNTDESSAMAKDGNVYVIANANKSKQEKNNSDSRLSITSVRCGSAAGEDLSRVFLAQGQTLQHKTMRPGEFHKHHKSPVGSGVIMTPSAYMTNEAWKETVEVMAKGIRSAPVVRDHPDWWFLLSLDGFGSHLCLESLQIFVDHKILVVKEEGDTSQVSQAYDQLVARADKRLIREYLDEYRLNVSGILSQYELILICNTAFNEVKKKDWIESFTRVNFRPSTRQPFKVWVKKHEEQVRSADILFAASDSLFEAMPALWKNMSEEMRETVCVMFKKFEDNDHEDPFKKDNLEELLKIGIPHDDILKLHGCYKMSKDDPSVLKDPPPPPTKKDLCAMARKKQKQLDMDYNGFSFAPTYALEPYLEEKEKYGKVDKGEVSKLPALSQDDLELDGDNLKLTTRPVATAKTCWPEKRNRKLAADLFIKMCNFTAAVHGYAQEGDLVPSAGLDVHVTSDQRRLLNPTPRDVQIGAIIDQCSGEKATKKLARRRIDFVTGNVNSYARVLNGQSQMESIKTYNDLAASIAAMNREKAEKEEERRKEQKKSEEEKAARKVQQQLKEEEDHERLLPGCKEDVETRGKIYVMSCNVPRKREILKHYFGYAQPMSNMKKADVDAQLDFYFSKMEEEATSNEESDAEVMMMETVANAASLQEASDAMVESAEEANGRSGRGRKRKMTDKGEEYAASM